MCRVYSLPDKWVLYYNKKPVTESKSFLYVYIMYLALDPNVPEQVLRGVRHGQISR